MTLGETQKLTAAKGTTPTLSAGKIIFLTSDLVPILDPTIKNQTATPKRANPVNTKKLGLQDEYFKGRRAFTLVGSLGVPYQLINNTNTQTLAQIADQFLPAKITTVAGLGNPQRFFTALQKQGISGKCIGLPDHAQYTPEFFAGISAPCILITEKDAVKCASMSDERIWVVPFNLELPDNLLDWVQSILQRPDPYRYTL
jgi:tetraacyldisaccharide 4'-kinase